MLALLGVILLTTHGDLTAFAMSPVALVAGVACAVCVTVYNCLGPRQELRAYPVSLLQSWAFLMGAVLFALTMHPWTLGYTPTLRGVGGILFVVLFGNLLAFNLYMTGVKLIGPEKSVLRLFRAGHGGDPGRGAAQHTLYAVGRAGFCGGFCNAGGAVLWRQAAHRAAAGVI